MYHPVLGTFLSRDPMPVDGDPILMGTPFDSISSMTDELDEPANGERINLYAYVEHNPTNYVDPSGLKYGSPSGRGRKTPLPKPQKKGPRPSDVMAEAEKRRGCKGPGDDSSHHCWAVCVYGILSGPAAGIATWGEIMAPSPDWPSDIGQNFKGYYCGMIGVGYGLVLGYDEWCDACCGTKPKK